MCGGHAPTVRSGGQHFPRNDPKPIGRGCRTTVTSRETPGALTSRT
ncbi:hypothetical protein Cus16_1392 [Curtobacterium sp. ER1/6]|nr:hypothetical protein Cus16_1392 [Curtobacterium sp. ER1/6]